MKITKILITILTFGFLFFLNTPSFAGDPLFEIPESDTDGKALMGFFDLRDRETYIQVTNFDQSPNGNNIHIQIYDVSNNCNENNFFDFYTPNDTHIYDLRNILTNDGTPSGVVLPDGAYGIFTAFGELGGNSITDLKPLFGNFRILDDNGYEYRTNLSSTIPDGDTMVDLGEFATFNFNKSANVTLSDVVIINKDEDWMNEQYTLDNILDVWTAYDIDIYDLNENPFSCRQIIASCINEESPLYEALLEEASNTNGCTGGSCAASIADIEFGINDAIPHSKGGELLCPGNNIEEGFVRVEKIGAGDGAGFDDEVVVYIGLNNGNGRGSMDAMFNQEGRFNF